MTRDLSELILELGEDECVPAASWIVGGVQATTVNHSSTRDTLNKFIQTIREKEFALSDVYLGRSRGDSSNDVLRTRYCFALG